MTKASASSKAAKSEPFESIVGELEKRVTMLEREDLDLTRAIEVFKESVVLAKKAQAKLDEAQALVTKLLDDELKR